MGSPHSRAVGEGGVGIPVVVARGADAAENNARAGNNFARAVFLNVERFQFVYLVSACQPQNQTALVSGWETWDSEDGSHTDGKHPSVPIIGTIQEDVGVRCADLRAYDNATP